MFKFIKFPYYSWQNDTLTFFRTTVCGRVPDWNICGVHADAGTGQEEAPIALLGIEARTRLMLLWSWTNIKHLRSCFLEDGFGSFSRQPTSTTGQRIFEASGLSDSTWVLSSLVHNE